MSLIVKPDKQTEAEDKSELARCIQHVKQMVAGSLDQIRERVTRLFEEGIDRNIIVNALLARKHQKHETFILTGKGEDGLTFSDFDVIEKEMGLTEPTEENRAYWREKFEMGRAKYLCPQCGYAGNDEFFRDPMNFVSCHLCQHTAYSGYFTRWSDDEREQYEKEQSEKSAKFAQERAEAEAQRLMKTAQRKVCDERVARLHELMECRCDEHECSLRDALITVIQGSSLTDEDIVRLWDIVASNIPRNQDGDVVDPKGRVVNQTDDDIVAFTLTHNALDVLNNAQALMTHADNAQIAGQQIKEFAPSSPTGQQAMQEILRPNTAGKVIGSGAKIDFLKSYRDFDALTPEEQSARFGKDVEQARSYLKAQARNQLLARWGWRIGTGVGLAAIGKATGLTSTLIHALLE